MKYLLLISLITACVELRNTQLPSYVNRDFHNSFEKYLVKDGYVKYLALDTSRLTDSTWIELYFDDFGSDEYYRVQSTAGNYELYKTDSVQYIKSNGGYFDSVITRRKDMPMEGAVLNETSRLSSHAYIHKPRDMKYMKKTGGYCWTYVQMDSVKYDCDVLYYKGIPIGMQFNGRSGSKYRHIDAAVIDTSVAFPIVLRLKE